MRARGFMVLFVGAVAPSPLEAADFGLLGGIGFHRPAISAEESFPVDGSFGLSGGGFFSVGLGESWFLEIDGLVSPKSYSSPELVTDTAVDTLWLDLPIVFGRALVENFRLYGGAQVSFRLRAQREFRDEDFDVSTELQDSDFGVVLGGRLTPIPKVSLDGRLEWGLRNIDDTNWYEIRTRAVRFLVAYRF
jgi:hypothetical protein